MKTIPNEFIETNSLEKRIVTSAKIMERYTDKVPVIILIPSEIGHSHKSFIKYLVSRELNVQYLIQLIRKNIKLTSSQAIFTLTENGTLLSGSMDIQQIYNRHKNEDGYLYITVRPENTFGMR